MAPLDKRMSQEQHQDSYLACILNHFQNTQQILFSFSTLLFLFFLGSVFEWKLSACTTTVDMKGNLSGNGLFQYGLH
jgi:hypothetical protein